MTDTLTTAMECVGATLIAAAAFLVFVPLGLLVTGLFLLAAGFLIGGGGGVADSSS